MGEVIEGGVEEGENIGDNPKPDQNLVGSTFFPVSQADHIGISNDTLLTALVNDPIFGGWRLGLKSVSISMIENHRSQPRRLFATWYNYTFYELTI